MKLAEKSVNAILAPLVRGLGLHASGEAIAVVPGPAEKTSGALNADIGPAVRDGLIDEEAAAAILRDAAAQAGQRLPSCAAIEAAGEPLGTYWMDRTLDAARARAKREDPAPLSAAAPLPVTAALTAPSAAEGGHGKGNAAGEICPSGSSSRSRADVARNRIALVTGGAQGFGEEITRGLAASGALVFIADLNIKGAEELAEKINAALGKTSAIALALDVSREESAEQAVAAAAETAGGLDILISNAGVLKAGSVLEQDVSSFAFTTGINYTGYFIMAKHGGRLMRRQNRNAPFWKTDIIQINSKSGLEGSNKNGAYAGGKFGGLGLTASFALELIEYNIKVNAVCPGNFFDGPLWSDSEKGLFVQYLKAGKVKGAKTVADVKTFYEEKVPMKRGCTGPDVMRAIYYIIEQEYETGQAVPVTGGQVMLH
ncbi:MAG: SDR family NAD(P)-dependent oxidoreductase [Treponema sp.]|jgi:sorbitol-6-phosphate 2-dehydrogenase|nr:SDR family NAD(P)-dependent oxidoreductase [Treponema sp.]